MSKQRPSAHPETPPGDKPPIKLSSEELRAIFDARNARLQNHPVPPVSEFHRAAAVLSRFDPVRLKTPDGSGPPGADEHSNLKRDCDTVTANEKTWFVLREDARRPILRSFERTDELQRYVRDVGGGDPDDPLQQTIRDYVLGQPVPLAGQTFEQLKASYRVLSWFEQAPAARGLSCPPAEEALARIERLELLDSFRALVGAHFTGRERELARLSGYARDPRGRQHLLETYPPLVIHGGGGIGKSSLLAAFLLNQAVPEGLLFAFLDFDRAGLEPDVPTTLLRAALRQLAAQAPRVREACVPLDRDLRDDILRASRRDAATVVELRERVQEFARLVEAAGGEKPYLFVLDTFEEVQYRSKEFVEGVWAFLAELKQAIPNLRPIVAGRAPVDPLPAQKPSVEIQVLDPSSALQVLERLGASPEVAPLVVEQVGRHPLHLRLAAEVLREEKLLGSAAEFRSAPSLPVRIERAVGEGKLHRRLLDQIHDKSVRALVYPGMVLRRITPDIIFRFLGEEADITPLPRQRARSLFQELGREVALVAQRDGPDELTFVLEVRREVLKDLQREQSERVERVHKRAIRYYRSRNADADRAEEIYHRLCLGQKSKDIDPRWTDGVKHYLGNAIEELPRAGQGYLAARLGTEAPPQTKVAFERADVLSRERNTARRVRDLMRLEKYQAAHDLLAAQWGERAPPADSDLWLLRARVLRNLNRLNEAQEVLGEALRLLSRRGGPANPEQVIDSLLYLARVAHSQNRVDVATRAVAEAEATAGRQGRLRLDLALSRLQMTPSGDPKRRQTDVEQAAEALQKAPLADLKRHPGVARMLAAELTEFDRDVVQNVLRRIGFGMSDLSALDELVGAVANWEMRLAAGNRGRHPLAARAGLLLPKAIELPNLWACWFRFADSLEVGTFLADLLTDAAGEMRARLAAALRSPEDQREAAVGREWRSIRREAERWVRSAYEEVLRRLPDAAGLDVWLSARFGRRLDEFGTAATFTERAFEVAAWANLLGFRDEFLRALREESPPPPSAPPPPAENALVGATVLPPGDSK
jgi:hypothetical protein